MVRDTDAGSLEGGDAGVARDAGAAEAAGSAGEAVVVVVDANGDSA